MVAGPKDRFQHKDDDYFSTIAGARAFVGTTDATATVAATIEAGEKCKCTVFVPKPPLLLQQPTSEITVYPIHLS